MRCPRRGPLEAARRDLCAAGVLGPGPRHVHPRGEEGSGNRCGVCPPSHTTGPGVRPDVHSDRTAEGQISVLSPDPSCLCRRTPPSLLVSSALPLTTWRETGGVTLDRKSPQAPCRSRLNFLQDMKTTHSLEKKHRQAFSLILVCVALASICTELD